MGFASVPLMLPFGKSRLYDNGAIVTHIDDALLTGRKLGFLYRGDPTSGNGNEIKPIWKPNGYRLAQHMHSRHGLMSLCVSDVHRALNFRVVCADYRFVSHKPIEEMDDDELLYCLIKTQGKFKTIDVFGIRYSYPSVFVDLSINGALEDMARILEARSDVPSPGWTNTNHEFARQQLISTGLRTRVTRLKDRAKAYSLCDVDTEYCLIRELGSDVCKAIKASDVEDDLV